MLSSKGDLYMKKNYITPLTFNVKVSTSVETMAGLELPISNGFVDDEAAKENKDFFDFDDDPWGDDPWADTPVKDPWKE